MKHSNSKFAMAILMCICMLFVIQQTYAQDGVPLTMQGLNHTTIQSAASRGAGGITIGLKNDVSLMFSNPTSLLSVEGVQLSVGGMQQYTDTKQDQEYGSLSPYSDFHLLMLGTTGLIGPQDTAKINDKVRRRTAYQGDSLQLPFDAIGPNWNISKNKTLPVQAFIAAPFSSGDYKFVAGLGAVEYANLNWYYANNNSLSPNILDVAKYGTIITSNLPTVDTNVAVKGPPYYSQWYQSIQKRDGSIYGYGASIATSLSGRFSLGISAMILSGSTRDYEEQVGRGRIAFYSASLRLSMQGVTHTIMTGTSDYSGQEFTISAKYNTRFVTAGFSMKMPTTITRKYSMSVLKDSVAATQKYDGRKDSVHVISNTSVSGEDKMELPWRGTIGISILALQNLTLGVEYEIRAFNSATYTDASGATSNPWLSSIVIRFGAEYRPNEWLALRGGIRQNAEVFQPNNAAIRGEAVRYPVYSLGCGIAYADAYLNVAYEYSEMRYVDTWSNSASINRQINNNIVVSIAYKLPWMN